MLELATDEISIEHTGIRRLVATMEADVFGPSRCLTLFSSCNILPTLFLAGRLACGDVQVEAHFSQYENPRTLKRLAAKIKGMPVTISAELSGE